MEQRGHTLRLTAVSVLVVLALTGFSTGRGHGRGSHSGGSGDSGGGGGCSSSSQDHDSSSSSGGSRYHDYDDDDTATDDTYDGSGSSETSTTTLQDAEAEIISCASAKTPYATVKVTNPNAVAGTFTVNVAFYDDTATIDLRTEDVDLPASGTAEVKVNLEEASLAAKVDDCEVDLYAPSVG